MPRYIALPFYAQLIERGDAEMKIKILMYAQIMKNSGQNLWAIANDHNNTKVFFPGWESTTADFDGHQYAKSGRYRRLFYGSMWMDQAVADVKLTGWEYLRIRSL